MLIYDLGDEVPAANMLKYVWLGRVETTSTVYDNEKYLRTDKKMKYAYISIE